MRRQFFIALIFPLLCGSLCAALPYFELDGVRKNSLFGYEQHQLPTDLRMLLAATDVARYEVFAPRQEDKDFSDECDALNDLILKSSLPLGSHYVARKFAPATYDVLTQMCHRLKITVPLLFVAHRGSAASRIKMVCLGGGYHGIVVGAAFLRRRTQQECQAMMACQLAQISKKVSKHADVARLVWTAVAGTGGTVYLVYLGWQSYRTKSFKPFGDALFSWVGWFALLGASWAITEGVYAHLKRKHAREAHKDALHAFGGNEDEYDGCIRRAYSDEQQDVALEYQAYRPYYDYVSDKINQLSLIGAPQQIVVFFRRVLEERKKAHQKTEIPHSLLLVSNKEPVRGPAGGNDE